MIKREGIKEVVKNRKAYHEYIILDKLEAGIALAGTEIKSARNHGINIKDSFVRMNGREAILMNMHIAKYKMGGFFNHDPVRPRKLLLHKQEIRKLYGKVTEKGLTIVPLRLYFKSGLLKVEIALVKGKNVHDKRDAIKKKDMDREWDRKKAYY
ncbi:MAG: SsrA-binding protein SmpB [Candidatus Muiribacteriota bacterium]